MSTDDHSIGTDLNVSGHENSMGEANEDLFLRKSEESKYLANFDHSPEKEPLSHIARLLDKLVSTG